jgi:RNA polymerase sigma-70 factor (ECF subfamily)
MDPHRPIPDHRGLTSGRPADAVPAMAPERIDALVLAAQGGDREAFTSLVVEFYPQLAGFLAFHAPTPEMMDELVQSTLVTAFERIADYQPTGSFAGWLKGIARNLLRRELSRLTRLTSSDLAAIEGLLADAALRDLDGVAPDAAGQDDLIARLHRCFERLSPRTRQIAERRFIDDVPLNRLAQQFKQSRPSIAKILFVVKRELRRCAAAGSVPP